MSRRYVGVRIGAAVASLTLVAGVATSPAVSAEARGEQAWWYTAMKIADAHKETTGKGVTVALIDTPIAPNVPELKGQNIKVGDNFCGGEGTGTGDLADHGTQMAALIVGSGKGAGAPGVAGVAPDVTLRTFADSPSLPGTQCAIRSPQATGSAIQAAVAAGARIISYSSGYPSLDGFLNNAIDEALAAGVIVVAAAGQAPDDPSVLFPASKPGVVAVAAVDRNAKAWAQNVPGNRAAFVISAPGVDLPAAGFNGSKWDSTAIVTGSSEATALVSGGLALVAAKYPKATGNQLIQHLIRNPSGRDNFGRDTTYGFGIMSVTKMLASDPTQWPDENPLVSAPSTSDSSTSAGAPTADDSPSTVNTAAESDDGGGSSPLLFVLLGVVVIAVGAFVAIRMRARSSGGAPG